MADDKKYDLPSGYQETEHLTTKTDRMAIIWRATDHRRSSRNRGNAYQDVIFKIGNIEINAKDVVNPEAEAEENRKGIAIEAQWLKRFLFYPGVPRILSENPLPLWLVFFLSYLELWIPQRWLPKRLTIKYLGELVEAPVGTRRTNYIVLEYLERLKKKDNRKEYADAHRQTAGAADRG